MSSPAHLPVALRSPLLHAISHSLFTCRRGEDGLCFVPLIYLFALWNSAHSLLLFFDVGCCRQQSLNNHFHSAHRVPPHTLFITIPVIYALIFSSRHWPWLILLPLALESQMLNFKALFSCAGLSFWKRPYWPCSLLWSSYNFSAAGLGKRVYPDGMEGLHPPWLGAECI